MVHWDDVKANMKELAHDLANEKIGIVGLALIVLMVSIAAFAPVLAPEANEEWSSMEDRWAANPERAPPVWYDYMTTTDHAHHQVEEDFRTSDRKLAGNHYKYIEFTHEVNSEVPPQDMFMKVEGRAERITNMMVTVSRPGNGTALFDETTVINRDVDQTGNFSVWQSLRRSSSFRETIHDIGRSYLANAHNVSYDDMPQSADIGNPVHVLMAQPDKNIFSDPEVLTGEYTVEIRLQSPYELLTVGENVDEITAELDNGQFPQGLAEEYNATQNYGLFADEDVSITVDQEGEEWTLNHEEEGYNHKIKLEDGELKVYGEEITIDDDTSTTFSGAVFGLMGTDRGRRDLWQGWVWGARYGIIAGGIVAIITIILSTLYGMTSAYYGGWVDEAMQRLNEIMMGVPTLPLLIILLLYWQSIWMFITVYGLLMWRGAAKVVRSRGLQVAKDTYIEASEAIGAGSGRIISRHMIPQILPYSFAQASLLIPVVIMAEAGLHILGLGDPSIVTWGTILNNAREEGAMLNLGRSWWWVLLPGLGMIMVGFGFIATGMAIERIINPKMKQR